jgi:LMBR1 domain-containing protein 1
MFAIFSMYMLMCVMKGTFKFGLRVPWLFAVHPMRPGDTLMNSFMFNVMLLCIAVFPVVGLCSSAFSLYSRLTAIDSKRVSFFEFFHFSVSLLLTIFFLTSYL